MLAMIVEAVYNFADKLHARRIRIFFANKDIGFVVDVGAHKGEFIRLVVDKNVPVFVFEPQKSVHETLESAISGHNVKGLHKSAVSDKTGEIELYVNSLSSTTSTLPPNEKSAWIRFKKAILGGHLVRRVEKVAVTTLDVSVGPAIGDLARGLLKIDVEGHEGSVLAGAQALLASGRVEFVQIEKARYKIYEGPTQDPIALLEKHGYRECRQFLFPLLNFSDIIYRRTATGTTDT